MVEHRLKDVSTTEESFKTKLLFTIFGFLAYAMYTTILTSTEDLLAHTSPASSSVWISTYIPGPIVTFMVPYIFDRLPPLVFVLALFPFSAGGLCCILLSGSRVWLKFLGIGLLGVADNVAGATAVCLAGYFENSTVKVYLVGCGLAYIFAPVYYTAMTSWLHVSYKIAISSIVIMQPTVFLICYLFLENRRQDVRMGYRTIPEEEPSTIENKKDEQMGYRTTNEEDPSTTDDNKDEQMGCRMISEVEPSTSDDDKDEQTGYRTINEANIKDNKAMTHKHLTIKEKLYHFLRVLPEITQLALTDIAVSLALSGVVTSLAFSNSPFLPSEHYKYYSIMIFIGAFVGRSYLGWADIIKPGLADKILIRRTWILVIICVGNMTFLVLASWYRFLPNVWVVLVFLFTLGVCSDGVYANISVIAGEIEDLRVRELSLGLMTFGMLIGCLCGTILAQFAEKVLVSHCLTIANDTAICFTRNIDLSNVKL